MVDAISTIVSVWGDVKLIFYISLPLVIPLLLFLYVKMLRRWPIKVTIWERRADGSLVETNDRSRKFIDKDGLHKTKLKKSGDTIIVTNYDWIVNTSEKPTNVFEKISELLGTCVGTIHLYKYGNKQYKPVSLKSSLEDLKFEVIDWDNMNFLVQEQRSIIDRTKSREDWKSKYLIPLAIVGAAALVFIISTYYATELWTKGQVSCEPLIRAALGEAQQAAAEDRTPNIPIAADLLGPQASQDAPGT